MCGPPHSVISFYKYYKYCQFGVIGTEGGKELKELQDCDVSVPPVVCSGHGFIVFNDPIILRKVYSILLSEYLFTMIGF
jgi:hypothetical protein